MFRTTLHQINSTVGDVEGNTRKIIDGLDAARKLGADIAVFPECAVTGYPPEDLLFVPSFIEANMAALDEIAKASIGLTAIVGFVWRAEDLYNGAAVLHDGKLAGIVTKSILPNYAVFDENRYFQTGGRPKVFTLGSLTFGVTVCEDIWYPDGPARVQALNGGADLIINISASPYHSGKIATRSTMLSTRASDNGVFVAFCNMVGGQDELVFDGNSSLHSPSGDVLARAMPFEEDVLVADLDPQGAMSHRLRDPRRRVASKGLGHKDACECVALKTITKAAKPEIPTRDVVPSGETEEVYRALVLGLGDYARKNGFSKVLLGLSGGIDSALTAAIALDALGASKVVGVTMPSPYSSAGSVSDSEDLARNLGIECRTIPIAKPFSAFLSALEPAFSGVSPDVTEENLQARIRGTILMALSNKFGWLLLSTGNKSETSVGYCTLYGDMNGGFDVLKDVPKTLVYRLALWRNAEARRPWIPTDSITKEPSAELRPDQKDSDSLPPYEVLDHILKVLVEEDGSLDALAERYGAETVARVVSLVDRNEYKRRQSPPGVRITPRAFGKDRRYPITNRFKRKV